jgi:hypothetical protein
MGLEIGGRGLGAEIWILYQLDVALNKIIPILCHLDSSSAKLGLGRNFDEPTSSDGGVTGIS